MFILAIIIIVGFVIEVRWRARRKRKLAARRHAEMIAALKAR